MERIENCEMIKAEIINNDRLEMKFYDAKNDVLRTVKFNKQSYDRASLWTIRKRPRSAKSGRRNISAAPSTRCRSRSA